MALTATGDIEALAISSIPSNVVPDGVWVAARHAGHWCCDQVGHGAGYWFLKRRQ